MRFSHGPRHACAGLGAGAVDEHGKAMFGVPAPGSYESPSLFNMDHGCAPESQAGKHVFPFGGAYTIKGRTGSKTYESDSPGPAAHSPDFHSVDSYSKTAPFGKAQRDAEAKRYISATIATADGSETPGPGAYRYHTGKGHANTMGDGPSASIGSAGRTENAVLPGLDAPGAKYQVPSAFNSGHGYSIAPLNSRERGLQRDRLAEAEANAKQYLGPGREPPAGSGDGPGPLAYDVNKDAAAGMRKGPEHKFGKAPLSSQAKVCNLSIGSVAACICCTSAHAFVPASAHSHWWKVAAAQAPGTSPVVVGACVHF